MKTIALIYVIKNNDTYLFIPSPPPLNGGWTTRKLLHSLLSFYPHFCPMRLRIQLPTWVRAGSKAPTSGTGHSID